MPIAKDKIVSFDYELTDMDGEVLDSSEGHEPLSYLHGNKNIIEGLENALEGKEVGQQLKVTIPPAEAYGECRDDLVHVLSRENFAEVPDLDLGMMFRLPNKEGEEIVVSVVEMDDQSVTVDGNHELAGETLNFDITIRDIREATEEEISRGHANGTDGHY